MHSNEMQDIESAKAGDIVAMFGVDCASGETFTSEGIRLSMTSMHVPAAVISFSVAPKSKRRSNFSKALNRFTKEDPTFRVHRDKECGQTIISGMGELHLEIYMSESSESISAKLSLVNLRLLTGKPLVSEQSSITCIKNNLVVRDGPKLLVTSSHFPKVLKKHSNLKTKLWVDPFQKNLFLVEKISFTRRSGKEDVAIDRIPCYRSSRGS